MAQNRMRPQGGWAEVSACVAGEQLTMECRPVPVHGVGRRGSVIGAGEGNRPPVGR